MASITISRAAALKIGKWLASKGRNDEAMGILCAGAVAGPNDVEGQQLLAEALRLDHDALLAKTAFQRMEGLAGEGDAALDSVIARYSPEEVEKLEKEVSRPQFMRAQVGFNNNLKYKEQEFHVQTEDSGLRLPHIITHLFADGGRVIKSHKRSYADAVDRADVVPFVRAMMKAQHMEMVLLLREGKFDDVIAGKVRGGMTVMTEPPELEVERLNAKKKDEKAAAAAAPATSTPAPVVSKPVPAAARASAPVRFHLAVLRSLAGGPARYEPPGDDVVIGASGEVPLHGEKFCHAREAIFHFRNGELWLEDLDGGNGVFIRIRKPLEVDIDDEFLVGDQLLRVEKMPERNDGPDPGPTYMWASPQFGHSAFRVAQIMVGGGTGLVRVAGGTTLQIGRNIGDLTFPKDPLVADPHCAVEEQAGVIVLTDLESRTGVFVRIRGEQRLTHGDEIIVGRTRMRVELPK